MSTDANQVSQETRSIKIITIDDEAPIRYLIRHSLRGENYEIFEAGNGKEGLEVIRQHKPDLVVLDVVMPEMNGYETLQAIRSDSSLAATPVLLLTGSKDKERLEQLSQSPHTDYLAKPFMIKVLKDRVNKLINALQPS